MTKPELIAEFAKANPHLTAKEVETVLAAIFDQISIAMTRGDRVELRGFGIFTVRQRPARLGRNPKTGETVSVGRKAVPFFKAGKELRTPVDRGPLPVSRDQEAERDEVEAAAEVS